MIKSIDIGEMIALAALGYSIVEISQKVGCRPSNVTQRFTRIGIRCSRSMRPTEKTFLLTKNMRAYEFLVLNPGWME